MTTEITTFRELLDARCPVTIFMSVKKPRGEVFNPRYRKLITNISSLNITTDKDGMAMTPGRLKDGYRKDQNVLELNQLVFDIDDPKGLTFDDLVAMIGPHAGVLHTTHSNSVETPRYRIVLPLSKPVAPEHWRRVRQGFLLMNPGIAKVIDPVCKEPARAFYLWSAKPETAEIANFYVSMGRPVRPEDFAPSHLEETFGNVARVSHQELSTGGVREGSRNSSLASYLGGLINRGLNQEQTLAECQNWNKTNAPPLEDAELLSTHRSIWARHVRNHPSAAQRFEVAKAFDDESSRFELIPAERLLGVHPKPREYVIEGFLPKRVVAGLFAPGGAGKSTLTLATAVSVSSASRLFGIYPVGSPGKVVLISGEDDREEIQRRLHRLTGSLTEWERRLVGNNLHVLDLADAFELFTERPAHGEVFLTGVPEAIASSIESSVGSVDLIIVDPASRFRGGEENSAGDTTRFVQALQYLRDRLGACIWLVHHVSKAARGTSANSNNARGSSALIDGLRLGYELTVLDRGEAVKLFGDAAGEGDLLTLRCVKSNYGKAPEPIFLRRNGDGTLSKFDENPGDARNRNLLRMIHEAGLTKSQFRDRFGGVKTALGLSQKALVREVESLVSAGVVETPDRGVMQLTKAGRLRLGLGDEMDSQRASKGQQDGSKPA
jgi:hypothetical protein